MTWWRYRWLQAHYRKLIGNGAYIVRPQTTFTATWLDRVNRTLEVAAEDLAQHPATQPKERRGKTYDGVVSQYPLAWAGLHGDIFHPLVFKYRHRIRNVLPAPSFDGYQ